MLRDYFSGGFDLNELTKGTKGDEDGHIIPADDAQDYSDEESLADDEGDQENRGEDDLETLIQEGQVRPEDEEDRMSVDLFGPDISSHQPAGQSFGADALIALLGHDVIDDQNEAMFDDLSPAANREQLDEEMESVSEEGAPEKLEEQKISNSKLVKEWFPEFSPNEILRFTEIFKSKPAELNRPVAKVPRGNFLGGGCLI